MKVIIDRFEGEIAVCEKEDKSTIDILLKDLPNEVRPGDVLIIENGYARVDRLETKERKQRIDKLARDLWE